ncbi:MAG: hypothetical protein EBY16_02395 [Gammaproteobacteria bacterium]|nr:hypothetical protein [Gammaproteobacteria bacterium]
MKTVIKYLVLPIGLMMSVASFAGVNEVGEGIATGTFKVGHRVVHLASDSYVAVTKPTFKFFDGVFNVKSSHAK